MASRAMSAAEVVPAKPLQMAMPGLLGAAAFCLLPMIPTALSVRAMPAS